MRRRDLIKLLGSVAATWPMEALAQQRSMPVIGFLGSGSADTDAPRVTAFHEGLGETGYVEGRSVAIEYRWADNHYDRLPALAADLVNKRVDLIATAGAGPSAQAAKAATTIIPIVFQTGGDPVKRGLVARLNKPGGNLTGVTSMNAELAPKRLELLHELVPNGRNIAVLCNPKLDTTELVLRNVQTAADTIGVSVHSVNASTEDEIKEAFAATATLKADAMVIVSDPFFNNRSTLLGTLSVDWRVPTIFQYREFVVAGGLMAYGGNFSASYRQLGIYAGRILNGEKPADLPVQQATKIELTINLRTSRVLGISFPLSLLGRADEVIE